MVVFPAQHPFLPLLLVQLFLVYISYMRISLWLALLWDLLLHKDEDETIVNTHRIQP
jgi:hypothetical protein